MNLTDDDVQEILKLLDQSPYDELTLETDRFKLTLRPSSRDVAARRDAQPVDDGCTPEADESTDPPAPGTPAMAAGEILEIYPPLPGTFYRAPSPGAEPFTEVGETVAPDTILALVETMKLMNSVMAGCHGEVVEICMDNAALVDVGDVIMKIRVAAHG